MDLFDFLGKKFSVGDGGHYLHIGKSISIGQGEDDTLRGLPDPYRVWSNEGAMPNYSPEELITSGSFSPCSYLDLAEELSDELNGSPIYHSQIKDEKISLTRLR